ncbi:MAG TPA: hypothetical protein VHZ24_20895 [Pirellulales bacterium]|jgi:uncharacterized protein with von Willebrand factor type A (vWA) domain|nr:hypothetical protein [Pirellulales bacterium]
MPHHKPAALGGVIHTYQKYDPAHFPSPTQPPPDLVSGAMEHMLTYGSLRELTDEELARAVHIDPSQIAGLGPSLEAIRQMLLERKRKILEKYETRRVTQAAEQQYRDEAKRLNPPRELAKDFYRAVKDEQLRDLERLWYRAGGERSPWAGALMRLIERLGEKYQIDQLAGSYEFSGRESMTVPQALEIKEELETIDRLLKQLDEAAKTAQIGVIDLDSLAEFAEPGDMDRLNQLQQQIQEYLREIAQQQGLEETKHGYRLTPKAYRLFQGKLLERIFSELEASRTGRHAGPVVGEGAVELQTTKPYEFGDSVAQMDIPASFTNALLRSGPGLPVRMKPEDIEIHRTRNTPKCATVVVMDMSGSMRYGGLYVNVKRMALALEGLIRREYPGDYLQFIEMFTFAKPRHTSEVAALLPKPVTVFDPVVMRRYDMSREDMSETMIPPHFTNIQHGLQQARRFLAAQDTPNRQIILITDGLPTAHFEAQMLYLLYPPHPATERATMREGDLCRREGITLNLFLLSSWSQSSEDVQFAYRLAERTKGRVFFVAGRELDRYVVWDYVNRRRSIVS